MKQKKLILICILFFSFNCFGNKIQKSQNLKIDSLKLEITILKEKLDTQNEKLTEFQDRLQYQTDQINSQTSMLDTAFDGVSAEISASSNYIGIFGIVLTLISIALGWYVTKIEKSIKSMYKDSELLTERNIEIKQSVEALSDKITRDSKGLYNIIRNEESNHILDRLISVPEDIDNLFFNLAARDLDPEHYLKLKEAYRQVIGDSNFDVNYTILIFQHFSGFWPFDSEIKDNIISNFDKTFEHIYKNDILKSSRDFFSAMYSLDFDDYKAEINQYINAFCKTKFCSDKDIYYIIDGVMDTKDSKFKFYNLVENTDDTLIFRKELGMLIIEHNFEGLSKQEEKVLEEIKKINEI